MAYPYPSPSRRRRSTPTWLITGLLVVGLIGLIGLVGLMSLRPTDSHSGTGQILSKDYVPAHTEVTHGRRGAVSIQHYDAEYKFDVRIDGFDKPMQATVPGRETSFEVGDLVDVVYHESGVWPFWRSNVVIDMTPTG